MPLHEHLVEQGFIAFVAKRPKGPLFYNAPHGAQKEIDATNPPKTRYKRAAEDLAQWARDAGLTDPNIKPNHAWRDTFKHRAAANGITERIHDAITGHAPLTVARTYGQPNLKDMAAGLARFPRYET